jgi:hypothetical protein
MHSIFGCTLAENDRFECNRSGSFKAWLKFEASDVIHLSIEQANVDILDKIGKK